MKPTTLVIKGLIRGENNAVIKTDIDSVDSISVYTPIGRSAYVEGLRDDEIVVYAIGDYHDIIVENSAAKTIHHLNHRKHTVMPTSTYASGGSVKRMSEILRTTETVDLYPGCYKLMKGTLMHTVESERPTEDEINELFDAYSDALARGADRDVGTLNVVAAYPLRADVPAGLSTHVETTFSYLRVEDRTNASISEEFHSAVCRAGFAGLAVIWPANTLPNSKHSGPGYAAFSGVTVLSDEITLDGIAEAAAASKEALITPAEVEELREIILEHSRAVNAG